jgi:seryl-tRNA synthetase
MTSLKNEVEKLINLEAERKSLLLEIEELKKMAEAKAYDLEIEAIAASDKLLKTLKSKKNKDKKIMRAITKMERQKRLSSEEFTKVYNSLWKDGPSVKFQNPDSWERARDYVF